MDLTLRDHLHRFFPFQLAESPRYLRKEAAVKNYRKPSLNARLREARDEQGWSQQKLADLVGTTPVNISRWENASHLPSPYYRERLSAVFATTPAELGLLPSSPAG